MTRPLDPRAIGRIEAEHARHRRGGPEGNFRPDVVFEDDVPSPIPWPVLTLAYTPDGKFAGTTGAIDEQGKRRIDPARFVLITDDYSPTDADLEGVRVDEEGIVHHGIIRRPPPPPPRPKPGPSDDPGVPLADWVIERIRENFRTVTAGAMLQPIASRFRPTYQLAFRPSDGRYAGPTLDWGLLEHLHELVVVTDDSVPTVDDLRRVRVHSNGWVTWLPVDGVIKA